MPPSAVRQITL